MVAPVTVHHALGSYPVYIDSGVLGQLEKLVRSHIPNRRVAMIADATVYQLYRSGRLGAPSWEGETLTVAPGEDWKSRDSWARLTDDLLARGFGRDSAIIALGGGVIGDLAGFVAATFMRGIPYLQVPTTLVGMVDASVGGKTGVNTSRGKNLVGAFHPPAAVIADPFALQTLPDREYRAGLAEAVKHGLIFDRTYFEWIEAQTAPLRARDPATIVRLVRRSVEIKAAVVSADEREGGQRAILNAGHTLAHALEQVSDYRLIHGEAVAVGLVVECELAEQLGIATTGLSERVAALLASLGLPGGLPREIDPAALLETMRADKKNRAGQVHFALPRAVGSIYQQNGWTTAVAEESIARALRRPRSDPGNGDISA